MPRKITPPPALAAYLAAHRAHVSYDGRAEDIPNHGPALDPEALAAAGLIPGSYVVNADGTLTPTVQPAGRDTTATRGRLTR